MNSRKKRKEKAFTIDDEVESLKQSFTVIHLWQKMWAIILDVRSKPKYRVCMHRMCAEYTNWSASAQIQFSEPYSSGWLRNNTNSSSLFEFLVEAKTQRIYIFFKSKERIVSFQTAFLEGRSLFTKVVSIKQQNSVVIFKPSDTQTRLPFACALHRNEVISLLQLTVFNELQVKYWQKKIGYGYGLKINI